MANNSEPLRLKDSVRPSSEKRPLLKFLDSMNRPTLPESRDEDTLESWDQERSLLTILSGQTTRWHMHPCMPPQNVADHSWHVAIILSLIDPDCSANDLKTALLHDVAELVHGDISAVVKRSDAAMAKSHNEAEAATLFRWTGHDGKHTHAIKVADKLADLWQFALQSRLGNREATQGFMKHLTWLQELDLEAFPNAVILRDAIVRWREDGSTILNEPIT